MRIKDAWKIGCFIILLVGQSQGVDSLCPADLDGNLQVSLVDYAQFQHCMTGPSGCMEEVLCTQADYTQNGSIDLLDFALFATDFETCDPCSARWQSLGSQWSSLGASGGIIASTVFDDGCGPALYLGGNFKQISGIAANGIARWDGTTWAPLDSGVNGTVQALAVFDDGSGPALYAAGEFGSAGDSQTMNIAKWDGVRWSALGDGLGDQTSTSIRALQVFDDGHGPALYAGGWYFWLQGSASIAKWTGTAWEPLDSGIQTDGSEAPRIDALGTFDDGTGSALFVGGTFGMAGGITARNVAKWDATGWHAAGQNLFHPLGSTVSAFASFDDGTGMALYAGLGIHQSNYSGTIARWNGTSWSYIGTGIHDWTHSFAEFDDGTGVGLFVAAENRGISKWNGEEWLEIGCQGSQDWATLAVYDDGSGPALFAGWATLPSFGLSANLITKWDGLNCSRVGAGLSATVLSFLPQEHTGQSKLLLTGNFTTAVDPGRPVVLQLDGESRTTLGTGLSGPRAFCAAEFDDGTGWKLYVGGQHLRVGNDLNYIAKWDGNQWSMLNSGLFPGTARALQVFDDGMGPALFVGGEFTQAGVLSVGNIGKWDGISWTSLGQGVEGGNEGVNDLEVFDDGSGPALFVGGDFALAGGIINRGIAKWNGTSWESLGTGIEGTYAYVQTLAVFDDGSGPAIFAGGDFSQAGGIPAENIAKWNGVTWAPVGTGIQGSIYALAVFDDGTGPALFVGGYFTTAGGKTASSIAKWDGIQWSPVSLGVSIDASIGLVSAIGVLAEDGGQSLYVGGNFNSAGGLHVNNIAKLHVPLCFE